MGLFGKSKYKKIEAGVVKNEDIKEEVSPSRAFRERFEPASESNGSSDSDQRIMDMENAMTKQERRIAAIEKYLMNHG